MKLTYGERRAQRWRRVLLKAWRVESEADLPPHVRKGLAAEMESWRARLSPAQQVRRWAMEHDRDLRRQEAARFAQMVLEAN